MLLPLDPFHPPPDRLDRSVLHRHLDAGRAVKSSPEHFHQHLAERLGELRHLPLIARRFGERHHAVNIRDADPIFKSFFWAMLLLLSRTSVLVEMVLLPFEVAASHVLSR